MYFVDINGNETVEEFIEKLKKMPRQAKVRVCDSQTGQSVFIKWIDYENSEGENEIQFGIY